jgi:acyl-coenzyme A thioesterase PaaI-like protein
MSQLPHTHSCFVCGESNPHGLNLRFHAHGGIVTCQFRPRKELVGFKTVVHGGVLATVLDEAMAWACAVTNGNFGFCAELNVRYLQPVLPEMDYELSARLVENRRNRLWLTGAELRGQNNTVHATATGKYIPVKEGEMKSMAEDLIGPWP